MRLVLLLAATLVLAGCSDADWDHVLSYPSASDSTLPTKPAPAQAAAGASASSANYAAYLNGAGSRPGPEKKCTQHAGDRAEELRDQGFDADLQKQVYDKTYGECMTWAARTRVE